MENASDPERIMESFEISPTTHNKIVKYAYDILEEENDLEWLDDLYKKETNQETGQGEYESVDYESDEFKKWFSVWVGERYSKAKTAIDNCIKNGHIVLYRCITAPKDWNPNARHLGIYWSWNEQAAYPHWGDMGGGLTWLITGRVLANDINWVSTLGMSVFPSFSDEQEVRIKKNAPVELLDYKEK